MHLESSYPVLLVDDVGAARDYFVRHFGFAPSFDSDWYVSLRHPEPPHGELAFVRFDHATVPAAYRTPARGVIVNVEVADAAAAWARLRAAGAAVVLPLRDEPFGQRHGIVAGPGDVLVDVIENIPPAPEFTAQFAPQVGAPPATPSGA